MGVRTNEEIVARWSSEPAPLLPILHEFQDRDGYLSDPSLSAAAKALRIPLAELYGIVTFYHHFTREPGGRDAPRVCTGPVCALKGSNDLLEQLAGSGARPMACAGRCDDPVPVLQGSLAYSGMDAASLTSRISPMPPPPPDGIEECVFADLRVRSGMSVADYRSTGGYQAFERCLSQMSAGDVIDELGDSGLNGRGGAGFPTWRKWKAVREAAGNPKWIVCNADEGEPGCFKDRAILDHDPHAVLEGMLLAAYATGATRGFIYLRYEYPDTERILEEAIREAEHAGFFGDNILGTDFSFDVFVRRGAGAYICGEETSLLNSLEGKRPFPRNRPPYPVTNGFENLPTVVNNVETLASIPPILRNGPRWYRSLGVNGQAGTKIISLSGDISRPGNYEVPLGLPLQTLLHEWAGGPRDGRSILAVSMAGLSGGFLAGDDLNVTLDEDSIRSKGSFLGAGGVIVFDDTRDMVEVACLAMDFFADESCGKCFPCRIGTERLKERLAGEAGPSNLDEWLDEVNDIGATMRETCACGLGMAAPLITNSLLKYFPDDVSRHVGVGALL